MSCVCFVSLKENTDIQSVKTIKQPMPFNPSKLLILMA